MNRVVRVNATDPRVAYMGQFPSYDSHFSLIFRGTSIKVYGTWDSLASGSIAFALDGNETHITFNGTTSGNEASPMYHVDNMEDGDHWVLGTSRVTGMDTSIEIDYFEIDSLSGDPFDLLSPGPAAQNVPSQAITVDDSSPEIMYNDKYSWAHRVDNSSDYNSTSSYTYIAGRSLSYSFDGGAIWCYGEVGPIYSFFNVSIDDSTPQRLTAKRNSFMKQQLIWYNASLGSGRHNITLTHDGDGNHAIPFSLDFFRVIPGEGTSTLLSTFSTTSSRELPTNEPPTNQNQTNRVPLAIGLALGLLALVVVILGSVYYVYRRRRGVLIDLDVTSLSPYAIPPVGRAGQQSSLLPDGKHPPQPSQPYNTPIATGSLAMSLSGSRLGPPPSYESPMYDWRV